MHVPDGFIDAPVSVATGVVAAGAVAVSLRGARRELSGGGRAANGGVDGTAPLAGLVAAFIFAVQMLNFPVAAGTSGHLLGGALAAILVGPYTGVLCVSVVLLMQGVLFADGGLTALGVNITDMGVVTVLVGYGVFRGLLKVLPRGRRRSVTIASFAAALLSVPAAAVCFTGIYALGGTADVSIGKVFTAMVGVHVLIGIGEAVITAATVGAVMAVRPDLVHGARGLTQSLTLSTVTPAAPGAPARPAQPATAGTDAAAPADALRPAGEPAAPAEQGKSAPAAASAASDPALRAGDTSSDSAAPAGADQAVGEHAPSAAAAPAEPGRTAAASASAASAAPGAAGADRSVGESAAPAAAAPAEPGMTTAASASAAAAARGGTGADRDGGSAPASDGTTAADAGVAAREAGEGGVVDSGAKAPSAPSARKVWWAGVAAAAVCAGVVSFYASGSPDGLEKVAADHGIGKQAEESSTADSPLADYSLADITNDRLSGGLAGLIGVGGTLALGTGVFVVVRRRRTEDEAPASQRERDDAPAGAR